MRGASAAGGYNPYAPIFFVFFALMIGALTQQVLNECLPSLPYTVVVLILGVIWGTVLDNGSWAGETVGGAFSTWANIDGHLILYAFLPALLFGDALGLNFHLFKKCLPQCILLAGPGVMLGAGAVAACAYSFLGTIEVWPVWRCLMFGSVFAATDPVAVVGILKALGVSPKLTMIISGESLLNDGAAIVMYLFFANLAKKSSPVLEETYHTALSGVPDPSGPSGPVGWYGIAFFFKVAILGVSTGWGFGLAFLSWISSGRSKSDHSASLVQVTLTICFAYFTFFIAEAIFLQSGVLATVIGGLVVGSWGWPYFSDRDFLMKFWHQIEWIFNTLLFFLSGVLLGRVFVDNPDITLNRIPQLLLMYVAAVIIRFLILGLFFPILRKMGYGFSVLEAIVVGWGGLRGAVGLALAIDIYTAFYKVPCAHPKAEHVAECEHLRIFATESFFYIGGFALLTLLINGTTTGMVLNKLGLMDTSFTADVLMNGARNIIKERCQESFEESAQTLYRREIADELKEKVRKRCTILSKDDGFNLAHALGAEPNTDDTITLLYYRILRNEYLQQAEVGLWDDDEDSRVTTLLESTDMIAEEIKAGIPIEQRSGDLNFVMKGYEAEPDITACCWKIGLFRPTWNHVFTENGEAYTETQQLSIQVQLLLCYIIANRRASAKLVELLPSTTTAVIDAAQKRIDEAGRQLDSKRAGVVESTRVIQLCNIVFERQRRVVKKFQDAGIIDDTQAHKLVHEMEHDKEHAYEMQAEDIELEEKASAEEQREKLRAERAEAGKSQEAEADKSS